MTRVNHRRTKKSKPRTPPRFETIKASAATVLLLGLSVFGLMRCFDGESGSPVDAVDLSERVPVKAVDVGAGKVVDPTLVNEEHLLKEEEQAAAVEIDTAPDTDSEAEDSEGAPAQDEETPKKQFPLYAVAFHFHTQFKAEPAHEALHGQVGSAQLRPESGMETYGS